jgi:hypothetical protein
MPSTSTTVYTHVSHARQGLECVESGPWYRHGLVAAAPNQRAYARGCDSQLYSVGIRWDRPVIALVSSWLCDWINADTNIIRHMSHATRHTSHASLHTSHVARRPSHVTRRASHVTHHTSHVTHKQFGQCCWYILCSVNTRYVRFSNVDVGATHTDSTRESSASKPQDTQIPWF